MKVKKMNPIMPVLPEMFQNAMPTKVPQMSWESGFISDFIHNRKLGRIKEAARSEAEIAEYKNQMLISNLNSIHEVMIFGKKTTHAVRIMELSEEKLEQEVEQLKIFNQQARIDLNKSLFEYNQMQKEDDNGTA